MSEKLNEVIEWEKDYLSIARNDLSTQQIELLEGRQMDVSELKIFEEMFSDYWKRKKS
tara:strand:- start:443 stop:616 length:174 start_codon:yes stop_codon:yes gene_type:complete